MKVFWFFFSKKNCLLAVIEDRRSGGYFRFESDGWRKCLPILRSLLHRSHANDLEVHDRLVIRDYT